MPERVPQIEDHSDLGSFIYDPPYGVTREDLDNYSRIQEPIWKTLNRQFSERLENSVSSLFVRGLKDFPASKSALERVSDSQDHLEGVAWSSILLKLESQSYSFWSDRPVQSNSSEECRRSALQRIVEEEDPFSGS